MPSLWGSLRSLIKAWIRGDVIRGSPMDCVWLSLKPPCVTLWRGERIEVFKRTEHIGEQGVAIRLECVTPRGREDLIVHPGDLHHPPRWEWAKR